MTIQLDYLVHLFATTLGVLDSEAPVGGDRRFKPGIGPLTETELTTILVSRLRRDDPATFGTTGSKGYSGSRLTCDLVIPNSWAIEIKLARPFGDNGKPAERWSENLLYPYPGNTSAIGDALKLKNSSFVERKAVMVIGYEHSPPRIPLEPSIRSFEVIAESVVGLRLGPRQSLTVTGLGHPAHQQVTVYAWEVS